MLTAQKLEGVQSVTGKTVKAAFSSLTRFAIEFTDGTALVLETKTTDTQAAIGAQLVDASTMPRDEEAVCKVDWKWIIDSKIASIANSNAAVKLQLDPAGPLSVTMQFWQGSPFLAFQPYRA
jgi:hypothetical protein